MRDTFSICPDSRSQMWKKRRRPERKTLEPVLGEKAVTERGVERTWREVRRGFGVGLEGSIW